MPFRLDEFRAKVQFVTSARTPRLVYEACVQTQIPSNTRYYQLAVAEKLSKDLGIPLDDLLAELPEPRGKAAVLFGDDRRVVKTVRPGQSGTIEEVR